MPAPNKRSAAKKGNQNAKAQARCQRCARLRSLAPTPSKFRCNACLRVLGTPRRQIESIRLDIFFDVMLSEIWQCVAEPRKSRPYPFLESSWPVAHAHQDSEALLLSLLRVACEYV